LTTPKETLDALQYAHIVLAEKQQILAALAELARKIHQKEGEIADERQRLARSGPAAPPASRTLDRLQGELRELFRQRSEQEDRLEATKDRIRHAHRILVPARRLQTDLECEQFVQDLTAAAETLISVARRGYALQSVGVRMPGLEKIRIPHPFEEDRELVRLGKLERIPNSYAWNEAPVLNEAAQELLDELNPSLQAQKLLEAEVKQLDREERESRIQADEQRKATPVDPFANAISIKV
jgi:chromosome segregation ATPase